MNKTLLVTWRPGGDWSTDLLFAGLVLRNGPENVIAWPFHAKYTEGVPRPTGDHERDYGAERRSLCHTPQNHLLREYGAPEITKMLRSGQIERIFIDECAESWTLLRQLFPTNKTPIVVVAGHDSYRGMSPEVMRFTFPQIEMMFLSNWQDSWSQLDFVRPYCWSVNFDHLWNPSQRESLCSKKVYDISFMGYNSHHNRERYVDHVLKRWGHLNNHIMLERRPNTMEAFIPKSEYFRVIAQSKICLNLRGAADDGKTLRFWEIPYVGSCMVTEQTAERRGPVSAPYGKTFVGEDDLDYLIEHLLSDDEQREKWASLDHRSLMDHHTCRHRVDQIYEELNG